jgi:large subunit ribosomal protein L25
VLYGHGQETISLTIPAGQIAGALRHGVRLVQLTGGVQDRAVISDVHWDTFGNDVLHVDLTRVRADESIQTQLLVECRGDAPGAHAGGHVEQFLHELAIRCPVTQLSERISVNINHLELGGTITAGQLELPPGAELLVDPSTVVVSCAEREEVAAEEEIPAEAVEPEVIGRQEAEGEGDGDS